MGTDGQVRRYGPYLWRGTQLDIAYTFEWGHGLRITVTVMNKQGELIEECQHEWSGEVVRLWMADLTRNAIRNVLHL